MVNIVLSFERFETAKVVAKELRLCIVSTLFNAYNVGVPVVPDCPVSLHYI